MERHLLNYWEKFLPENGMWLGGEWQEAYAFLLHIICILSFFFFLSFLRWTWLLLFLQFKTQQGFYQYSAVNILCNSPYTLNSTEMIENHLLRGLQNNMGYHERSIYFDKFLEDRNQWIEESYYKGDTSNPNNDLPCIKFNRGPSIILRAPEKLHLKKLYYRVQLLKKLKWRPLACEFKLERNPM